MKESLWQKMNGKREVSLSEEEIQFMSPEEAKEFFKDEDDEQANYWNQFLSTDRVSLAPEENFYVRKYQFNRCRSMQVSNTGQIPRQTPIDMLLNSDFMVSASDIAK